MLPGVCNHEEYWMSLYVQIMNMYTCTYNVHIQSHTHTHTHVHKHMHIHTHTYTYMYSGQCIQGASSWHLGCRSDTLCLCVWQSKLKVITVEWWHELFLTGINVCVNKFVYYDLFIHLTQQVCVCVCARTRMYVNLCVCVPVPVTWVGVQRKLFRVDI